MLFHPSSFLCRLIQPRHAQVPATPPPNWQCNKRRYCRSESQHRRSWTAIAIGKCIWRPHPLQGGVFEVRNCWKMTFWFHFLWIYWILFDRIECNPVCHLLERMRSKAFPLCELKKDDAVICIPWLHILPGKWIPRFVLFLVSVLFV